MADNFNVLDHSGQSVLYVITSNNITDLNQPAALQEFPLAATQRRLEADLTGKSQARLQVQVVTVGFAGSKLGVQYSTDSGSTWFWLTGTASASAPAAGEYVAIDSAGLRLGAWVTLASAARTDVLLRMVSKDGDGAVDPAIVHVAIEVR